MSALAAAGERMFSRSMKYHRRRGVLTASFHDPGCMVQVGDEPNVRGAHRLVSGGMAVTSQNAWPSLRFDVKAANRLRRPVPVRRLLLQDVHAAPLPVAGLRERAAEVRQRRAGFAGHPAAAARQASRPSRRAHRGRRAGRDGRGRGRRPGGRLGPAGRGGASARRALALGHGRGSRPPSPNWQARCLREPGIEVLTDAVVLGRYDGNWIAVLQRGGAAGGAEAERLVKARAKVLVAAPGLIERPYVFSGNDLPGVMLSTAVRRLINLYAVRPGERAVVLSANADGDAAVADLKRAGVEVARVEDARLGGDVIAAQRARGRALGSARRRHAGSAATCWSPRSAGPRRPSLLNMAGNRPVYSPRAARFFPDLSGLPSDVLVTGGIAGDGSLDELTGHATAVGTEAARRAAGIGRARLLATPTHAGPVPPAPDECRSFPPTCRWTLTPSCSRAGPTGSWTSARTCRSKDLRAAVAEGYDSAELAKRFTTATMGPVQGKLETVNTVAIIAAATGAPIAADRDHDLAAPLRAGQPGRPGRAGLRAGAVLAHAALARGARRGPAGSRGLDTARSLRRPGGRGAECARARRHHRRHPDREARPAGAGRGPAAEPAVRQQMVQAGGQGGSGTASCAPTTAWCSTTG